MFSKSKFLTIGFLFCLYFYGVNPAQALNLTVKVVGSGMVMGSGIFCGSKGSYCNTSFDKYETADLHAVPDSGYRLYKWGGECLGSPDDYCTVFLNLSKMATVTFVKDITVPAITKATVSPTSVVQGNSVAFNVTLSDVLPNSYSVQINYGDGLVSMTGSGTSYKLTKLISKLGQQVFKVGVYDSKSTLQGNTFSGNFEIRQSADVTTITPVVTPSVTTSYTKIANDGSNLLGSAKLGTKPKDWACTKDNKTGLIWEVKTNDDGLRDKDWWYSWYEPDASKNGGSVGYQNGNGHPEWCKGSKCDTYAYTNAVNTKGLCGANDWRLPTKGELESLVYCSDGKYNELAEGDYGSICLSNQNTLTTMSPTINTMYFPNTMSYFWSSSPYAYANKFAWFVNFDSGLSNQLFKYSYNYVRLTHAANITLPEPVIVTPVKTTGYTKIANNGSTLSDSAKLGSNPTDWACTKDNKTGLIWEVKTSDGGYRVLILEARNRIGGRIWTDNTLNVPLDLGASWIHGVTNNPIKQLADKFNLKTVPTDYDARQIYQANGTLLTEEDVTDLTDRYDGVYGRIIAIQKKRRSGNLPDISWQTALEQELVNEKFTPAELTELYYSLNTELEHEYAADLSQLSLLNSDVEENAFEGGDHLFLKGYGRIIEQLVQSATLSSDILINQIVKSVDYSKTTNIKVTTNQAVFQARAVLVTLPLGVLKANTVKFSPPLPITKQNSIKKLGFGVLNKTYLRFPEYFWEDQDAESQLVNSISTIKGHFAEWLNLYFYTKQPILLGFNAAKHGKEIEGMSDKAIIAEWMQTLRAIYGNDIPDPDSYLITRWNKDPYALGSYSYVGVGASAKDYQELAKSVNNQLFFAGEATSFDHPATVHGAFLSGEREAKKIIAAIPVTGK